MGEGMDTENADSPGSTVEERILAVYGKLSRSERMLADVILAAPDGIAEYSSSELADDARVSKATAARFFKRLGYANYRAARLAARETRRRGSPLDALGQLTAPLEARGNFGIHLANDVENLTRTGAALPPARIDAAVRSLKDARRVFVIGFRNSYALAAYLFAVLNTVRPGVTLVGIGSLDLPELLAGLGPDDCILAIGFRRRPAILRRILATARKRQAAAILICESDKSKTARLADVVLPCHNDSAYLFDSYVAGMSVLNFLCSALAMELAAAAWQRLEDIEALHESIDDLAPGTKQG